jgi:glycosyltransferase involved in cell wall biosynthesis
MSAVSIVIPTHNRLRLLRRTLRAVTGQRGVDLEVLVVDDASVDGTAEGVAALGDDRVRCLRNAVPTGVSAARNLGIAAAEGDWIAFCDDDDLWSPEKLAAQLTAAAEAAAGWVYTGDVNVDDRLRVLSGSPPHDPASVMALMGRINPIASGASNVIVRAETLAEVGGFDPGLRRTEDWDLWIRLARIGTPAWVCRPLVAYRFHGGNLVGRPSDMVDEPRRLAERYDMPVDLAAMHRRAAWTALRGGRRGLAARHYARAVACGDVRSLGRAGVALLHPAAAGEHIFRWVRKDPGWVSEAEGWLAAFEEEPSLGERSDA